MVGVLPRRCPAPLTSYPSRCAVSMTRTTQSDPQKKDASGRRQGSFEKLEPQAGPYGSVRRSVEMRTNMGTQSHRRSLDMLPPKLREALAY